MDVVRADGGEEVVAGAEGAQVGVGALPDRLAQLLARHVHDLAGGNQHLVLAEGAAEAGQRGAAGAGYVLGACAAEAPLELVHALALPADVFGARGEVRGLGAAVAGG